MISPRVQFDPWPERVQYARHAATNHLGVRRGVCGPDGARVVRLSLPAAVPRGERAPAAGAEPGAQGTRRGPARHQRSGDGLDSAGPDARAADRARAARRDQVRGAAPGRGLRRTGCRAAVAGAAGGRRRGALGARAVRLIDWLVVHTAAAYDWKTKRVV